MVLATRLCGSIGGALVVYYVNLTITLTEPMRSHFLYAAVVVVIVAVALSQLCGLYETRYLRPLLRQLFEGNSPDPELATKAGQEAVLFPVRHLRCEAWLVPCSTLVPVAIFLRVVDGASWDVLRNITLAVFMGVVMALMSTFFIIERCMTPIVKYLLDKGVAIDFDSFPANRLRARLNLCFGLIIMITAVMIGTLAGQRATEIIRQPTNQDAAVESLRTHTAYITFAAVVVGLGFATAISQSVAARVARLVQAMKRVAKGSFSEELHATGNDEIDVLTRQFNTMVHQLAQNDATIRDLNMNLERKVEERTLSLRLLHAELDERNTELETALAELKDMQSQLVEVAHRAGMTEIATGVLHNVGNVLNSVNVSVTLLGETVRKSRMTSVSKIAALAQEHGSAFQATGADPRIQKMPEYLGLLSEALSAEQRDMLGEVSNLAEKIQHIKNIITAQQTYTRRVSFRETVGINDLLDDLLALHEPTTVKERVQVLREFSELPPVTLEKSKLLQVLDNLIKNALEAMAVDSISHRVLRVATERADQQIVISVADTGHGISHEQLKNIFRFGFTTKASGNGFGLHSAALAMTEMGGTISVQSDGEGRGATFTITLPLGEAADLNNGAAARNRAAEASN